MSEVVTDSKGRKLTIKTLNVLDQAKLLRAIGADQSQNQPYVALVQAVASVSHIDETPQPSITNEKQIDAAIARVGDEGILAIWAKINKEMADMERAAVDAVEAEGEAQAANPLEKSA